MNKLIFFVLALCVFTFSSTAQKRELILRKADNNFYLEHKVVAKESFFSVGRLYNVSAKSIAAFNKLDLDRGLNIDQKIRIPLTDTNFTQAGNSGTPVYYKAGLNTNLARISEAYRQVPVGSLKYWNKRTQEEVSEGEKLIIGFLLTKEMPSVTLNHPPVEDAEKVEPVTTVSKVEVKEETVEKNPPVPVKEPEVKKEESSEQGFFKASFDQQVKTNPVTRQETVTAGIFKTSSGWEDAKYYVLMDNVTPGTIIRLTNPSNGLSVYAKVLGGMSGIKLNEGLEIRISNASASVLQITETDKFIMKVSY